ncbi:maleylacetoacetate isomerase [Undibacterium arcticum]|uniref:Maleylacetoacetate isomerase n=1 Tax=Undibacterium arcticum TaxID=1762892 RepID=A0ABV7F2Y8_9BURK
MKLHTFFRSSASYRVRIALNLKQLPYEAVAVHLSKNGGEQHSSEFQALNPQELLPVLQDEGEVLTQSLAILEYLEERYPNPALLPDSTAGRARVRALSLMIACEIHPLNNRRVLQYLSEQLHVDAEQKNRWYRHWVGLGLAALEKRLAQDACTGRFCHGDTPGMADCCLVPQIYNAQRFECDLSAFPTVMRIFDECMGLEAFAAAGPARQFDAA